MSAQSNLKLLGSVVGALCFALAGAISTSAMASLVDATVQSASYLGVSFPPPAASPTECTIIDCNILDYQGPSGPTNSPLPTVPVTYLEDSLTATTVSVGDTQITITNDFAGLFCPAAGCTAGEFSGYVFTFTGAPDITKVTVDSASSSDFQPVLPGGLTFTATTLSVNVNGDNLAVGDKLILDVTTNGVPTVPEPSTWAMMALGFGLMGFLGYRKTRGALA
jgi:PEP-CTERM motif-containing protein